MKLSDSEKRDLINLIEKGQYLPEKFRFLLFQNFGGIHNPGGMAGQRPAGGWPVGRPMTAR